MIKVNNSGPCPTSLLTSLWMAVTSSAVFLSIFLQEKRRLARGDMMASEHTDLDHDAKSVPTVSEACSTRPSAKPRPIRPVWSPDVTIQRENCTDDYAQLFCLNGGSCFRSKFNEHYVVACKCARGWFGRRCEYNDIGDKGSLSLMRPRIESASVSLGVFVLVLVTFLLTVGANFYQKSRRRRLRPSSIAPVAIAASSSPLDSTLSSCDSDCSKCQNSSLSVMSVNRLENRTSFDFQRSDRRSRNFVAVNEYIV